MKSYVKSLNRYWNGEILTEKDTNNLCDLMLIPIAIFILQLIIF